MGVEAVVVCELVDEPAERGLHQDDAAEASQRAPRHQGHGDQRLREGVAGDGVGADDRRGDAGIRRETPRAKKTSGVAASIAVRRPQPMGAESAPASAAWTTDFTALEL